MRRMTNIMIRIILFTSIFKINLELREVNQGKKLKFVLQSFCF